MNTIRRNGSQSSNRGSAEYFTGNVGIDPVAGAGEGQRRERDLRTRRTHGASPSTAMTHIAIQEADAKGKNVEWLEKVSDEQYQSPLAGK